MAGENNHITLSVIAFGPLSDEIQRRQNIKAPDNSTVAEVISILNLEKWLHNGLTVAINGNRCEYSAQLYNGDELALLPPVSGG